MDVLLTHSHMALGSLVVMLVLWNYVSTRSGLSHLPLPPGPRGYPIIGNFFNNPQERAWRVYDNWFKTYGDIVYFKVFNQGYLILASTTRTSDLLEKRSANYSDRQGAPMVIDLVGWDMILSFMPYGQWWRRHRRAFHKHFHAGAVYKYRPIHLRETHAFLRRLLETPENFMHHIQHSFAAMIMDVAYGIKVSGPTDPYILLTEESVAGLAQAVIPGQFLVDFLPILKYVPSWMPGAGFKRKANLWRKLNEEIATKPFENVKKSLRLGTATPSVAAALIEALPNEDDEHRAEEEQIAKHTAVAAYFAGADTTVSAVQFLFLAMAMHPDIQRRAQVELDTVIGPNRLPDFNDRLSLPYINAIVKETMRWQLVTPLGLGHICTNDDEYDGYLIPKGTLVFGNAWSILHDPKVYPSPEEYKPERWLKDGELNPDVPNPSIAAFGFGRRICPGRYLSDDSLYLMVSNVLSIFNISPPVDEQGNPVHLNPVPTPGVLSYPTPFECVIKPRSSAAEALIRQEIIE